MSRRRVPSRRFALSLAAAAAALLSACGGEDPGDGGDLSFNLYASRAVLGDIGAFQLALVQPSDKASTARCSEVTRQTCLRDQVPLDALVTFTGPENRRVRAVRVEVALMGDGSIRTQEVTMRGVPVGRDYALVVEALDQGSPRGFITLSCLPQVTVSRENSPLNAQVLTLPDDATPSTCGVDPTID